MGVGPVGGTRFQRRKPAHAGRLAGASRTATGLVYGQKQPFRDLSPRAVARAAARRPLADAVRAGPGGGGHRVDRRAFCAGQRTYRAAVRHPAGSAGERDAPPTDHYAGGGQSFSGDDFLALLATALCAATSLGCGCPPAPGSQPSAGGNSQPARGAHRGRRSHRQLAGAALGPVAGRRLRRITRSARGDRKALGWQSLAASPRPLSAATALPGGPAIGNSFRPTAYRSRRSKTQSTKQDQNQIHPASRSSLEENLEADISTWQKTGHFYFALTYESSGSSAGRGKCRSSFRY